MKKKKNLVKARKSNPTPKIKRNYSIEYIQSIIKYLRSNF